MIFTFPKTKVHVIGDAVGEKSKQYLANMKSRCSHSFAYLAFVRDISLRKSFDLAAMTVGVSL